MKSVRLSLTLIVLGFLCSVQAFSQPAPFEYFRNTPVPLTDFTTSTSTIDVPDVFSISDLNVMVDIKHPMAKDLKITLTGPGGSMYVLSNFNGNFGANYENTIFDSAPGIGIPGTSVDAATNVTAFFRGIYKPQTGTTLPTSGGAAGTWTLSVTDNALGDEGKLIKWGLLFNKYGQYKDVRWGIDLNYTSMTSLSYPFIDDFTAQPPYTVHGFRPENYLSYAYILGQNSKIGGDANLSFFTKSPSGTTTATFQNEYFVLPDAIQYSGSLPLPMNDGAGTYEYTLKGFVRGDVFMTQSDNTIVLKSNVTAGSLGYDNGDWAKGSTYNPPLGECNAMYFEIPVAQTLTSVDIWQGSQVEQEVAGSTSRVSVRVWDANGAAPVEIGSTGQLTMPPQGQKWVSYRLGQNGVALPAGGYATGICVDALDAAMGIGSVVGLGVDLAGTPFEPLGFFGRYTGWGNQLWMAGGVWSEEVFRDFTTKMIRPNFITRSDVGVTSIVTTNSPAQMTVVVKYGIYSQSTNPNVMTVGRVTVKNTATGATIGTSEQRVFFVNQAPYMTAATATFLLPAASSGTYEVTAEVLRGDDENLINNSYTRTLVVPFAPVVVVANGIMTKHQLDQISAAYGSEVQFVDRSTSLFSFPQNGMVLWVGPMSSIEADQARTFADAGNYLAFITNDAANSNTLSNTFSMLATPKETASMNAFLATPANLAAPKIDYSLVSSAVNSPIFADDPAVKTDVEKRMSTFANNTKAPLPVSMVRRPGFVYNHSNDMRIEAKRINEIVVAEVVTNKKSSGMIANAITNPANFELTQNYPNPFNPSTTIAYNLPNDANVSIRVFDVLGREIAMLANSAQTAGRYLVTWDGTTNQGVTVSTGMYLYRMEATPANGSPFVSVKKMVLAK